MHEDKMQQFTWMFIDALVELYEWKIKCPAVWPVMMGASVDGTQKPTNEPRDDNVRRNRKNFCYKYNIAGLNYQVALATWTNRVLYSRADPGSTHDITAMRKEFIGMIPAGCRVIADSGYTGKSDHEKEVFAVKNCLDDDEVAKFKAIVRARQECFNSRITSYKCFKQKFTHGIDKHPKCFKAVVVQLQYAIEDTSDAGEPLDTV
ncbi:expressed unknown protein [Seminavis robusta]|uniref:DDE Tnp4 domain-containing protein n=1 Tax=Seminavis robusta TaxID=568900 RepID=A0A9N8DZ39_9STRA|nr:expressed unknown protein [Seminavis robusta]|eukprot:Sro382_g131091.1  (205) ;mRNA; r:43512-44126